MRGGGAVICGLGSLFPPGLRGDDVEAGHDGGWGGLGVVGIVGIVGDNESAAEFAAAGGEGQRAVEGGRLGGGVAAVEGVMDRQAAGVIDAD